MSQLTTAEMIRNVEIAQFYWKTIPEKNVFERLAGYLVGEHKMDRRERRFAVKKAHNCGTVACFGGWVPAMPEFAAMGVRAVEDGMPYFKLKNGNELLGGHVAGHLFGSNCLFYSRGECKHDGLYRGSDHALVTRRLEKHLSELRQQVKQKKSVSAT
jgi:hypothetical protein